MVRTNTSLTVAGTTSSPATNVTVNTVAAIRYADRTFARTNYTLLNGTNTFAAIALDNLGRADTNLVSINLPTAVTFLYDQNGNLRTNGARIFEYDDENQLIRITEPNAWKSEFKYDGKMRRRTRQECVWSGSWVTNLEVRYVYDGNLVVQERHYQVFGASLAPLRSVTYTLGPDLSESLEGAGGIGGLPARTEQDGAGVQPASTAYYHADWSGNVTMFINTNQTIVARYLYDPFGNTISSSGSLSDANLYRFSSKECHATSRLVYYLYRYYDPSLQRWPNRDPLGEPGFEVVRDKLSSVVGDGHNLYLFGGNAPIDNIDALGLRGWKYGNWCGPLKSGPKPPIDGVDAACQVHDNCLAGPVEFCNPIRQLTCNLAFCARVAAASCLNSPDPVECGIAKADILSVCRLVLFPWAPPLPPWLP